MKVTARGANQNRLRLIRGGLQIQWWFHHIRIVAAPESNPPFEVEARAFEEDTFLIMSAKPEVCGIPEDPIRLMTDLINTKPEQVGSVRVQGTKPLRLLAIVHDVNQDPTWKRAWIKSALKEIWREVEQRKLTSVGIPLLGTLHGKLQMPNFVELFADTLMQAGHNFLKRIWLITPAKNTSVLMEMLKDRLTEARNEWTKI